jgi:hypothetical protein
VIQSGVHRRAFWHGSKVHGHGSDATALFVGMLLATADTALGDDEFEAARDPLAACSKRHHADQRRGLTGIGRRR